MSASEFNFVYFKGLRPIKFTYYKYLSSDLFKYFISRYYEINSFTDFLKQTN